MRKEVKLGFAIGGVLLSVLIVYVLVISGGSSDKPDEVKLVTTDTPAGAADKPTTAPVAETAKAGAPQAETAPKLTDSAKTETEIAVKQTDPFTTPLTQASGNEKWGGGVLDNGVPAMLLTTTEKPAEPAPIVVPTPAVSAEANRPTPETTAPPASDARSNRPANIQGSGSPQDNTQSRLTTPRTHVVQKGETFYTIAAAVYGNPSYYAHLMRANPNIDERKLRPGMTINVPAVSDVKATDTPAPAPSQSSKIDPKTEYRVVEGDSLFRIAQKLYGKSDRADQIYDLNRSVIGSNPGKLKVGAILRLPEAPLARAQ